MSKSKEYSWMTKDTLMSYTFVALVALAIITTLLWWWTSTGWALGATVAVSCVIAVAVSIGLDYLLSLVLKEKAPLNTMSAAVFGLIVALSYSYGTPAMVIVEVLPLMAPQAFIYVAAIAAVGMVLFKKAQGLLGRKYVNPAAAAKLLVLAPFLYQILLPQDHATNIPTLATALGYSGSAPFAGYITSCFGRPDLVAQGVYPFPPSPSDVFLILTAVKFHGWAGGASSIAVIIVGLGLFLAARRYIKWRITLSYLVAVTAMALIMNAIYGGDALLRIGFHLFIGSSIFLAFFMATDPATTPLTHMGQGIFGVGLGVLTVLIQTYMNFFGGSILALVIMNLTSPLLDKVGLPKPTEAKREPKLPKAQQFETVKTTSCIRCGACMYVCCHSLSPILIKEAFDKGNVNALRKLQANLCDGCGNCSFVCPARIDLKGSSLRAKASLRTAK